MPISPKYLREFEEEQNKLKEHYPEYTRRFNERLWYTEECINNDLKELLTKNVVLDEKYWGDENPDISIIVNNVIKHIQKVKDNKEPLRLVKAGLDDDHWRKKDPAFLEKIIERYGKVFKEYKIDQTVSVKDINKKEFIVQRSSYLDQFGSNIFCDEPDESGETLRKLNIESGKIKPFNKSTLANTIGVAALFVDRNDIPILRWRKHEDPIRRMAVMREGWHCTTSGVLTWQDFVSDNTSLASVIRGIERETENEAGLFSHEKINGESIFNIEIIAFARELKRAGKPQFFFKIKFPNHTAEQIIGEIVKRPKIEGEEYGGRKRKSFMGRNFGLKPSESRDDFMADSRLCLKNLDKQNLQILSRTESGIPFTFEGYANIYYMLS